MGHYSYFLLVRKTIKSIRERKRYVGGWKTVGLDISAESLGSSSLMDLKDHAKQVVDNTRDLAAAYKPNFAFFERWGSKGFTWLENLVEFIGDDPILIADAKRGDIGSTASQYAKSVFNYFNFDCVTLSPYLGGDSIEPFIEYKDKGVFILCRTSNPSGAEFQSKKLDNDSFLYDNSSQFHE